LTGYKTPKFLKNRETLIFQKLAGDDCSPPYQLAIKRNAVSLQVGMKLRNRSFAIGLIGYKSLDHSAI
jgi:hypothetical protein